MTNDETPNLDQLIELLDEFNASFDRLPLQAQMSYATQCDLNAAMLLLTQIIKSLMKSSP